MNVDEFQSDLINEIIASERTNINYSENEIPSSKPFSHWGLTTPVKVSSLIDKINSQKRFLFKAIHDYIRVPFFKRAMAPMKTEIYFLQKRFGIRKKIT